jgi:hypothetical protein
MPGRVSSINDLLKLVISNPSLAPRLKEDPEGVAGMFGVKLAKDEAEKIKARLDIKMIAETSKMANSMVAKALQGMGLEQKNVR